MAWRKALSWISLVTASVGVVVAIGLYLRVVSNIDRAASDDPPVVVVNEAIMAKKTATWRAIYQGNCIDHTTETFQQPGESLEAFCKRHEASVQADMQIYVPKT